MRHVFMVCFFFFFLTLSVSAVAAMDDPPSYSLLVRARSLKCTFSIVMLGDWKEGKLTTSVDSEEFVLHFDSIDITNKRARLIGNMGAEDVGLLVTSRSLTFVEITPGGNPNFTTVYPNYKDGGTGFIAVTSRHIVLPSLKGLHPFPSQHHGSCVVWQ